MALTASQKNYVRCAITDNPTANDIIAAVNLTDGVTGGTSSASQGLVLGATKQIDTIAVATQVLGTSTTAGAANAMTTVIVKKTGIADNSATDVITVTVPNANHAAAIRVTMLSSNGAGDAFESSRVATGTIVVARTTGANAVAVVSTIAQAQIATVSGGATHTLAYAVSSIVGAVGATNTFTITVTLDDSASAGSNQCIMVAELINSEVSGVTMAAA